MFDPKSSWLRAMALDGYARETLKTTELQKKYLALLQYMTVSDEPVTNLDVCVRCVISPARSSKMAAAGRPRQDRSPRPRLGQRPHRALPQSRPGVAALRGRGHRLPLWALRR